MLKVATNLASRSSSLIHFNLRGLFRWKFSVTCLVKNGDQFSQFKFKPLLRKFHEIEHSETLLLNREWYFQKTNSTSFDVERLMLRYQTQLLKRAVQCCYYKSCSTCPVIAAKLPSFWEGALPCPPFALPTLLLPSQPSFLPSLSTYLPSLLTFSGIYLLSTVFYCTFWAVSKKKGHHMYPTIYGNNF